MFGTEMVNGHGIPHFCRERFPKRRVKPKERFPVGALPGSCPVEVTRQSLKSGQTRLDYTHSPAYFAEVISINIYEAKTQLSRLVAAVETRGETVILCRNGTPVADLVPHHKGRDITLEPDPTLRGARYTGDPTAALGAEEWPEELR
jgi:antitoxin (DNA-binding transcriptional repressor) of toxin-antitoxin stability system